MDRREYYFCCTSSAMGKKGDPKVPILPSRTRKGTVLNTSATLDSPSVMSKFTSPPLHDASIESVTMSDTFDDASTTLDDTTFLGYYIETQTAKSSATCRLAAPLMGGANSHQQR